MMRRPPRSTLFPYTTLFRSQLQPLGQLGVEVGRSVEAAAGQERGLQIVVEPLDAALGLRVSRLADQDRKSTRLNSSHANISYAVFCLKKKKESTWSGSLCTR